MCMILNLSDYDALDGEDESYSLDFSKPNTRWALAEVAKTLQHIANISCLPTEEMFVSFFFYY